MSDLNTQKEFYANIFEYNPLLFRCVCNYYRNYIYYVPQKFFLNYDPKIHTLLNKKSGLALHEGFFLKPFGINSQRQENFFSQEARIALLPQELFSYLLLVLGMSLCHEDISKTVLKSDVEKIKILEQSINLPSENYISPYNFALQKASTYVGHCNYVRQHAENQKLYLSIKQLELDKQVLAWGIWAILSCISQGGQNLTARTILLLDWALSQVNIDFRQYCSNNGETIAWPLVRVLIFNAIACPWEDGWPIFFS